MTDAGPTFLTRGQIWGDKALDIMKRCGKICAASDLAKILGATVNSRQNTFCWSASDEILGLVCGTYYFGEKFCYAPYNQYPAGRPALPPAFTSSIRPSEVHPSRKIEEVSVVQYGEYPQNAVPAHEQSQLSDMLNSGNLRTTGKKYTFYSGNNYTDYPEYEYNGNRYICVPGNPFDPKSQTHYGETIEKGKNYWVQVSPIEWLVDPSGWWLAKDGLFSGMPFDFHPKYEGVFENTEIAKYLKNTFAKQMLSNTISHAANNNHQKSTDAVQPITHDVTANDKPMPVAQQISPNPVSHNANDNSKQSTDAVQPITHNVTATDKPTPVAQQISPNANDNNSVAKRIWKFFRGKNR